MTKEKPKFIKMYDPETGECLGPLINPMTHEEAHGKKPKGTLEIKIDKEAWDKLKYEHDVDGDHVELSGPPVFDPIKGTLEFNVNKEDADKIVKMLGGLTDEEVKELARASTNAAEIFCRIADCTYDTFSRYAEKYASSIPALLPNIVKSSIATISCVADLSEIILNVPLLVYALYYERYNNSILPSSQMDIVFDIVSAMLELKKEGMIQ
jgi:hypothetical protein